MGILGGKCPLKIGNNASYDSNGFDTKRAYGKVDVYKPVIEARRR